MYKFSAPVLFTLVPQNLNIPSPLCGEAAQIYKTWRLHIYPGL